LDSTFEQGRNDVLDLGHHLFSNEMNLREFVYIGTRYDPVDSDWIPYPSEVEMMYLDLDHHLFHMTKSSFPV
jgi:hypothetical protein